jgi:hypothetical protein
MNKYSLFSDLMVSMCFAFSLTFLVPLCKVWVMHMICSVFSWDKS